MKVLHIQDAWEIPKFVKEIQGQIDKGMRHIYDVTTHYGDCELHFLFSHVPLTPQEIETVLLDLTTSACRNCGNEVNNEVFFCPNCGTDYPAILF